MGEGLLEKKQHVPRDGLLSLWGHPRGSQAAPVETLIGQEEESIPADHSRLGLALRPHSRSPVSNLLSGLRCPSCSLQRPPPGHPAPGAHGCLPPAPAPGRLRGLCTVAGGKRGLQPIPLGFC